MKIRITLISILAVWHLMSGSLFGMETAQLPGTRNGGTADAEPEAGHSEARYIVRTGDSLGKILRGTFSLPDAIIFSKATRSLLKKANPSLRDLNDLKPGNLLIVPAVLLLRRGKGHTGESSLRHVAPKSVAGAKTIKIKPAPAPGHYSPATYMLQSGNMQREEKSIPAPDELNREKKVRSLLRRFAEAFGGTADTDSQKKIELPTSGTVTLDCSKFPLYAFPQGTDILLDYGGRLPAELKTIIFSAWPETRILSTDNSASPQSVLATALDGCGLQKLGTENRYVIRQHDARITVMGDIVFKKTEPETMFLLTTESGTSLPPSIEKFLASHGIAPIALSDDAAHGCPSPDFTYPPPENKPLRTVAFTDTVLQLAGISYERNVKTKLRPRSETGISFELPADRKFLIKGKPCCIFFKKITDTILTLFQTKGYNVLQIDKNSHLSSGDVKDLLNFINCPNTGPVVTLQYDHSTSTGVKISFPGFLLQTPKGFILFTNAGFDKNIANYISNLNIKRIIY